MMIVNYFEFNAYIAFCHPWDITHTPRRIKLLFSFAGGGKFRKFALIEHTFPQIMVIEFVYTLKLHMLKKTTQTTTKNIYLFMLTLVCSKFLFYVLACLCGVE